MPTKPIVDEFPFPFDRPMATELKRVLAGLYRTRREVEAFVPPFGIDTLAMPFDLSALEIWQWVLQQTAIAGTTRELVKAARAAYPKNPRAPFLDALLADEVAPVSAEPVTDNAQKFLKGTDAVFAPEALLFFDDLTMPVGLVAGLISTLQVMVARAPAVCLLKVSNAHGDFFGTGFKIAPDLVLTNEHVLFPKKEKAAVVHADFGFDVLASGASASVTALQGDTSTIAGERADDWAVIKVAGMDPRWPTLGLAEATPPKENDFAYILQHPGGQRKRLGFVRNKITDVDPGGRVVHYLTDTEPGSSGAPVLDAQGHLIALHHAGGTPIEVAGKPPVSKNEGILASRVLAGLKAKGLLA